MYTSSRPKTIMTPDSVCSPRVLLVSEPPLRAMGHESQNLGQVQLEDPIAAHIDPILWALNHSKLQQHFGAAIDQVQIQQLGKKPSKRGARTQAGNDCYRICY